MHDITRTQFIIWNDPINFNEVNTCQIIYVISMHVHLVQFIATYSYFIQENSKTNRVHTYDIHCRFWSFWYLACWRNLIRKFSAPRPECTSDYECPTHLACIREKCQDPCQTHTCGINAECMVRNHRALCVCIDGYVGDPFTICEERKLHTKDYVWVSISLVRLLLFINNSKISF